MKIDSLPVLTALATTSIFIAGCASTGESSAKSGNTATASSTGAPGQYAVRYKADDNRTIEIGKNTPSNGGLSFKDPHMEKCWLADGFNFTGYDALYIAPTLSTAKYHDDEGMVHDIAKKTLPAEFAAYIGRKGIFPKVITSEADIQPGSKVLKLENTITEFSKGGGAARYFAGIYGAGQPVLRVVGNMTDNGKPVFTFEARRSGASAAGRLSGGFMRDEDVQIEDIRSMALDLSDFMAAVAGKYVAK